MPYHELKHEALTKRIIGCAMKVHSFLGHGYPEKIYQRALKVEFDKALLKSQCEAPKDIYYEGIWVGLRRLDILVEEIVLIELKATSELNSADFNQIINLLRVFDIEVGLLINFGKSTLEFKRFANTRPIRMPNK